MKLLVLPFSWLYALIMICRNKAFDMGVLKVEDVGVPVISVGNMTMGGTGKTPLVEYIVRLCLARGRKVAVVSRGYRRESRGTVVVSDGKILLANALQGGDEPVQIAKKFPEAIVVVGGRRVEAARKAVTELKADVIVLDDGFQHRYIKRTLDIVVLDSRKDVSTIPMIPAGERREPLSGIERAHLVAFSKSQRTAGGVGSRWMLNISGGSRIHFGYSLDRILRAGSDKRFSPMEMKGTRLFLFSGIGDHAGFVDLMARSGLDVIGDMRFPDHHAYTKADLQRIFEGLRGADALLTTEKDFVRLTGTSELLEEIMQHCPLHYAGIAVDILQNKREIDSMIDRCLTGKVAS